jgi:hypothetical protein
MPCCPNVLQTRLCRCARTFNIKSDKNEFLSPLVMRLHNMKFIFVELYKKTRVSEVYWTLKYASFSATLYEIVFALVRVTPDMCLSGNMKCPSLFTKSNSIGMCW